MSTVPTVKTGKWSQETLSEHEEFESLVPSERAEAARKILECSLVNATSAFFVNPRKENSGITDSASYYQHLHDQDVAYGQNNWLLPHLGFLRNFSQNSILEIGCGNGKALRTLCANSARVIGLDWAQSPELRDLPPNAIFVKGDARHIELPTVDVITSADVLEHIPSGDLYSLIKRLHAAGRWNYHVIACYDDGHSHLSIGPPENWLALFWVISSQYRIASIETRHGNDKFLVCVITNIPL